MKIVDRYIIVTIVLATLVVLLMLLGMQCFIIFIQQVKFIGHGTYHLPQAILYVLMQIPANFYQFFPMAGLMGSLAGLGILASNSELVVMRASGVSLARMTASVLLAAFLLMLLAIPIGEKLGPIALKRSNINQTIAIKGRQAINAQQGAWVHHGNDFIHIQTVLPGGRMMNITRYHLDAQRRVTLVGHAESGDYAHGRWQFRDIVESHIGPNRVTTDRQKKAYWPVAFDPKVVDIGMKQGDASTSEMTLPQLRTAIQYMRSSGVTAERYELAFWQRVFQPLATMVMIFLGVPFIFGPLRSATMGLRIFAGIVVGFCFYILNQLFGPISIVYQLPPLLVAVLPMTLFAFVGGIMLQRAR